MNEVVIKPSLREQFLHGWAQCRVIFFSAPCGFGKSTAATALLSNHKTCVFSAEDPEFLHESTAALQAEGLQVYGFIPGDALLRGPLYKGLPTLEAHRTAKQVRKQRRRAALENAFRRRVESKLEILANIAQALEKTRAALDDGIDEPGEQELAKHREELDALIAAVRQREAQVRTRSIQRYETALRVLRANPSAKAKAELGEAFDSLRKLLEK